MVVIQSRYNLFTTVTVIKVLLFVCLFIIFNVMRLYASLILEFCLNRKVIKQLIKLNQKLNKTIASQL